jgi:hypothetical protein
MTSLNITCIKELAGSVYYDSKDPKSNKGSYLGYRSAES